MILASRKGIFSHDRQFAAFPDYFHPNISKYWRDLIKDFHKIIKFDGLWIVSVQIKLLN